MSYYSHDRSWSFALFSANLHRYLPDVQWPSHPELYLRWKTVHDPKPIEPAVRWDTSSLDPFRQLPPRIICLYHLGMHAQLPKVLADAGIAFDLLLDRSVFVTQREQLLGLQADLRSRGMCCRFLMSDDPQVLLKARGTIRQGRHLLVFADGNSGTAESLDKKVCIQFLDAEFYARAGIAWLSYLLQVPVLPLSHDGDDTAPHLVIGAEISALPMENRSDYAQRCLFELYDFLAVQIRESPWRWECWGYLHQLNCYLVKPVIDQYDLLRQDISLLPVSLQGKKGLFSRKYFYCLFA